MAQTKNKKKQKGILSFQAKLVSKKVKQKLRRDKLSILILLIMKHQNKYFIIYSEKRGETIKISWRRIGWGKTSKSSCRDITLIIKLKTEKKSTDWALNRIDKIKKVFLPILGQSILSSILSLASSLLPKRPLLQIACTKSLLSILPIHLIVKKWMNENL